MNYLIVITLLLLVLFLTTSREGFTEAFGLSGYTKPSAPMKFNDSSVDLSGYAKVEASVDNDMIESFVMIANKEITKRTGVLTYIIETSYIHKYRGNDKDLYECMFMVVKKGGFSHGFSILAFFEMENGAPKLISLRSQPINSGTLDTLDDSMGKAFVEYSLVKEKSVPLKSEFDSIKNKLI